MPSPRVLATWCVLIYAYISLFIARLCQLSGSKSFVVDKHNVFLKTQQLAETVSSWTQLYSWAFNYGQSIRYFFFLSRQSLSHLSHPLSLSLSFNDCVLLFSLPLCLPLSPSVSFSLLSHPISHPPFSCQLFLDASPNLEHLDMGWIPQINRNTLQSIFQSPHESLNSFFVPWYPFLLFLCPSDHSGARILMMRV